eukprot:5918348-Pyramimonas_sp.AAC.1
MPPLGGVRRRRRRGGAPACECVTGCEWNYLAPRTDQSRLDNHVITIDGACKKVNRVIAKEVDKETLENKTINPFHKGLELPPPPPRTAPPWSPPAGPHFWSLSPPRAPTRPPPPRTRSSRPLQPPPPGSSPARLRPSPPRRLRSRPPPHPPAPLRAMPPPPPALYEVRVRANVADPSANRTVGYCQDERRVQRAIQCTGNNSSDGDHVPTGQNHARSATGSRRLSIRRRRPAPLAPSVVMSTVVAITKLNCAPVGVSATLPTTTSTESTPTSPGTTSASASWALTSAATLARYAADSAEEALTSASASMFAARRVAWAVRRVMLK